MVVVVEDVDELDDAEPPLTVVDVVEEAEPAMVDDVEDDGAAVVEVGTAVVVGRIVAPGATVLTGFEVGVSPAADRFTVPLAHAANNSPLAMATARACVPRRPKVFNIPSMGADPSHYVNAVDNVPETDPTRHRRPEGRR